MNIDRKTVIASAAVLGILAGIAGSFVFMDTSPTYCEKIEKEIRNNQSFNGTVACFEPGAFNATLPESISNKTDLRCVCRKSYQGNVQWFNIAFGD